MKTKISKLSETGQRDLQNDFKLGKSKPMLWRKLGLMGEVSAEFFRFHSSRRRFHQPMTSGMYMGVPFVCSVVVYNRNCEGVGPVV